VSQTRFQGTNIFQKKGSWSRSIQSYQRRTVCCY